MSKLGILIVLALAGVAGLTVFEHRSEAQLQAENEALRSQIERMSKVSAENQRLSNLVAQAKVAQTAANDQFQELLKLRTDFGRLSQEKQDSNRVAQVKLAQNAADQVHELGGLREEVSSLTKEITKLRDEIRQLGSAAPAAVGTPVEERASDSATAAAGQNNATASAPQQPVSIRMIDTHGESFADKLKRSVGAQDGDTFQEVFAKFLQSNGVDISPIVGLVYDDRTGRVIVRAPQPTLEQVERLTTALDRAQP
jgi:hypothetical protein